MPKPMKPTRTVSSLGVVSSITSCCPAGRSGTGTSRGAYSFVAVVSLGIGVQDVYKRQIMEHPLIPEDIMVRGFIIDSVTGELTKV